MKTKLILTSYNRPELLSRTIIALAPQIKHIDAIEIIDDGSNNQTINDILKATKYHWGDKLTVLTYSDNSGYSSRINQALMRAFNLESYDYVVTMDNDVKLSPDDWYSRLIEFLHKHQEIGILAPDKPGCYVRLRRPDYDEVEWAVSNCYAINSKAYYDLNSEEETSWLDETLGNSIDPDVCYRVRMQGYRVALMPNVFVEDMGVNLSTVSKNLARDNFLSNAKWNRRFLGNFLYKCPGAFLRWEEYPQNVLFRRLVNVQQGTYDVQPTVSRLSEHQAELVTYLSCRGNNPTPDDLKKLLDKDIRLQNPQFQDIDPNLTQGKRKFDFDLDYK